MLIIEETSNYTFTPQIQGNGVKKAARNNDLNDSKVVEPNCSDGGFWF